MASSIPWREIKALSFDIYGTLVDWQSGIASAARATSLGPFLPADDKTIFNGVHEHDMVVQREHPTLEQPAVIAEALRRYARDLGVVAQGHLTAEQVERAAKEYGAAIGTYPAFPDTVRAIQTLGTHYKLIPLSNVDRESFGHTLAGPLKGCHFDAIYTAQDIGSYKPDLKNFHYLLDHLQSDLGVDKAHLCHVAQSLYHDHGPAKEMGICSVWVDRGNTMGEQDAGEDLVKKYDFQLRVETLGELAAIVEEAFEGA